MRVDQHSLTERLRAAYLSRVGAAHKQTSSAARDAAAASRALLSSAAPEPGDLEPSASETTRRRDVRVGQGGGA